MVFLIVQLLLIKVDGLLRFSLIAIMAFARGMIN